MIQANEIRIFNKVLHNNKIITVWGIEPHCGDYSIRTLEPGWVYLKNCNAIELSEGILLKCGFEIRDQEDLPFDLGYKLYITKDRFEVDEFFNTALGSSSSPLKYLHQLQNLYFAIKGKELEINL